MKKIIILFLGCRVVEEHYSAVTNISDIVVNCDKLSV